MIKRVIIIPTITDRKVGFEFKNRNLIILNQTIFLFNYYTDSGITFYVII